MSGRESKYEMIEKYLGGELRGEDLAAFEQSLQQDAALRKELALHKELQEFMTDENALQLRQALADADRSTQSHRVVRFNKKTLAIAASIAAIVLVSYFLIMRPASSTEKLFAQHFQPYQMVLTSRSNDSAATTQMAAVDLYQRGLFDKAIPYWTSLLEKDSANAPARFYRGICYLGIKEPAGARKDFEWLLHSGNSLFAQQANWYIGLSYLQQQDSEKARAHFNSIKEQEYKKEEIDELLGSL